MPENQVSQTTTTQREPGLEQRIFTFKATYLIWLGLGLLEALIAFRVGLKLIGADPSNAFANFIYSLSYWFVYPFLGLTATPALGAAVFEFSSVIAMLVYVLLGWGVERLVWVIFYRPREAAVEVTNRTNRESHT